MTKNKHKKNRFIIILILTIFLLYIYSRYIETDMLIIKDYNIETNLITNNYNGLKIIHFSDIHYKRTVDKNKLEEIVKLINKQNPDIVIFTGDLLDNNLKYTNNDINTINKILKKINTNLGFYCISGNHDKKYIKKFNKALNNVCEILNNEEKLIYYNDSTPISIIGLNNMTDKTDILNNTNPSYRFVISHSPDIFDNIKNYDFNTLLAGHSHNGQINIPIIGVIYTPSGSKKYYQEYYNIDNKNIYISNGIGTSTIPLRFNSKPSINLYRLYKK